MKYSSIRYLLKYTLMIIASPLYLYLKGYKTTQVMLNVLLYLFGWFPSVVHAFYLVDSSRDYKNIIENDIDSKSQKKTHYTYLGVVLVLMLYVAFQALIYNPGYLFNTPIDQVHYIGGPTDPFSFIWIYHWWQWAIKNGINPLYSNYVWAPEGISISFMPLLTPALIFMPLAHIAGGVFAYNFMQFLMGPLGAISAFMLIKYLYKNNFASLIGGLLYGFSPYSIGHMAFTNIDILFPIPLIVMIFIKYVRGEIKYRIYFILESVMLLFVIGFSTEIFATIVYFGVFAVFLLMPTLNKYNLNIKNISIKVFYIVLPAVLTIVLYLPILIPMIKNYNIAAPHIDISVYKSDLLALLLPAPTSTLSSLNMFKYLYNSLQVEVSSYFGVPLLLVVYYVLYKHRNNIKYEIVNILLTFLIIASLSVTIDIFGFNIFPNPGMVDFSHLPLLKNALPNRFAIFIWLILSALLALYWIDVTINRRIKIVMLLIILLFWFPQININRGAAHIPDFFLSNNYKKYITQNANVLILPYAHTGASMLYQSIDNFYYRMPEGYTSANQPNNYFDGFSSSFNNLLFDPSKNYPNSYSEFNKFIASKSINYIVVVPFDEGSVQGQVSDNEYIEWRSYLKNDGLKGVIREGVILYKIVNKATSIA